MKDLLLVLGVTLVGLSMVHDDPARAERLLEVVIGTGSSLLATAGIG